MTLLPFFPFFHFLSFTFLFNLFFKFMPNMSKCRFMESPGHSSESKLLIISQRERERERERENRQSPVVMGWSGSAVVHGKYSEPKRPINLDNSKARVYCTCSRCGWGCLDIFVSCLSFLFSFSLFGRRPDIDWNTVSKGR